MLQTLANLAQVIGVFAVLAAIGFGVAQIRQYRQQRRDAALALCAKYETLGYLVYRGIMPLELAEHMERRGRPQEAPAYERHRDWPGPS